MENQLQKIIENRKPPSKIMTDEEIKKAKDALAALGYL